MTKLLRELITIPERVHRGDFVLRLTEGVDPAHAATTLKDYVVTEQLVSCFDRSLDLIRNAIESRTSKAAYLHGSFGSGKSHFMAVLHLLLQGNAHARGIPELASAVARHDPWLQKRRCLLVPYHMIGARSMEAAVLGGYVEHVRKHHAGAPTPAVYVAESLFADARRLRERMGDEKFFATLNEGRGSGGGWGAIGSGWDAKSFEEACRAAPREEARTRLVHDLIERLFSSYGSVARSGDGEAYVRFEEGLSAISAHAKGLGYDALVLFLDELILWLASQMADQAFVSREVQKVVKLVEAGNSPRPIPIVSLVARQRDLRELVGDHVPGAEQLRFADQLKHWEGRFDLVKLEDRNLAAIAEKRVLAPKSEAARVEIEADFERTTKVRRDVMDVLLTTDADRKTFRQVYPFSPAFIQALVAVSSALQRERTALKVLVQLLSNQRDTLALGHVVPVGELYDVIAEGDEPFSEAMARHFDNAKRLYHTKLLPRLEKRHGVRLESLGSLPPGDAKVRAFRADDLVLKTLLLAALVPEVEAFRDMTATKLAALNHGTIRAPIEGQEPQLVLQKLRALAAEVGEIKISDSALNPTISIQLSGVDTETILDRARVVDVAGNRRAKVRELLFGRLGIPLEETLLLDHEFLWRGTKRSVDIVFGNVRELPEASLKSEGDAWKVVIDFPFDDEGYGPRQDVERLERAREQGIKARTVAWVPAFFSRKLQKDLGTLVILDHVLAGERLNEFATHLSAVDRTTARALLDNQRSQLRQVVLNALDAAYGIAPAPPDALDMDEPHDQHLLSLAGGFVPAPPVGATLGAAFQALLDQMLSHQFPGHPRFEVEGAIKRGDAEKVLQEVRRAIQSGPEGRLASVERPLRPLLARIAQPLRIGTMYEGPFVLDTYWPQKLPQWQALHKEEWSVGNLRRWMDSEKPMGLPRLLQDLVIIFFAERTNRSFSVHGSAKEPKLDDLPDEAVLLEQALPSEAEWKRAGEVAGKVLGLASSPLCSGSSVAVLATQVREKILSFRDPARSLVKTLGERMARLGVDPANAARMKTARAAQAFVEAVVAASSNEGVVAALAAAKPGTSFEAMGRSLVMAQTLTEALTRPNDWTVIESMQELGGHLEVAAKEIQSRVAQALASDELAAALGPIVQESVARSVALLKPPAPPRPPPPGRRTTHGERKDMAPDEAAKLLDELKRKVEGDRSSRLSISWDLETKE